MTPRTANSECQKGVTTMLYKELQLYIPTVSLDEESIPIDSVSEDPFPILLVNGHKIIKARRFKNKAHERAYDISLFLASKKPAYVYTQRMGDMVIRTSAPIAMHTTEVINILHNLPDPYLKLPFDTVNPNKVAHDAMKFVVDFFVDGEVTLKKSKRLKHMWFLEISQT